MSNIQLPDPFNSIEPIHIKEKTIKAGETLFLQGDKTRGLFYLHTGAIELTRETSSGHCIVIHRAYGGAIFAEASLFSDKYHCTAIALKDATVMECRRGIVSDLLQNNLEFTRAVVMRFATQIQESRHHIELLSIRSADERILAAINSGLLVDDISKLANLLGLAQETAYRALKRLVDKGQIIKNARGKYQPVITDD